VQVLEGTKRGKGEPMSEAVARTEVERRLVQRSLEDEDFRRRLLADPKAVVEEELATRLPEEVQVRVVEKTADTIYLVLPSASSLGGEGEELSDQELEAVAGGWDAQTAGNTCAPQATGCCIIGPA
jgi:hypothetical protein